MPANKNWARWIFASISRHFTDSFSGTGIPLFIEGQHRDTKDESDFFELRVYGPQYYEPSKGHFIVRVEVNILVQSVMNDNNYHTIHQNAGIAAAAMTTINVYKKGNGADDDQSFVGCLKVQHSRRHRDEIETHPMGQIEPFLKLTQTTVEAHYEMVLEEG